MREERAGGNQRAVLTARADKAAAPALGRDGKAQLVILGQGIRGKGQARAAFAPLPRHQPIERPARCRAAHARPRQRRTQRIAHHQRLAMGLGKFLAIMAADVPRQPRAVAGHQRLDRKLHEVRPARDGLVQQAERGGIDHVFRIVEHQHGEPLPAAFFIEHQRGVKAVEAIGLGGRPVMAEDHQPQPRIPARRGNRRAKGGRIVTVAADIKAQRLLRPGGEEVVDRLADHRCLAPGGDQHGDRPRNRPCPQRRAVAAQGGSAPCRLQPQPRRIHRQIIKRTDQEKHASEQQQFVLQEGEALPQYRLG